MKDVTSFILLLKACQKLCAEGEAELLACGAAVEIGIFKLD
jgi:hypothetical protein